MAFVLDEEQTKTETNPDSGATSESEAQGESNEGNYDLPENLVNALKALLQEFMVQEQWDRRQEVIRDSRNRFYSRGYQHLWHAGSSQGALTVATPGGVGYNSFGQQVQCPSSIKDYEIFYPFERVITSILTQNPPGVDFRPDSPDKTEDVESAEAAEAYRQYFDRCNDVKDIQTQIVRMLLLSGRTVSFTFTEENPQKFGYEKDGTTPKKVQTTKIFGTLESKVSVVARSQQDCARLVLSDDPDIDMAREEYKDSPNVGKIQKGTAGIGENEYERIARLGVLQGTRSAAQVGDQLSNLTTRQRFFVRPAAFNSDRVKDEKDELLARFPEGCMAVFCGQQYIRCDGMKMDAHIDIDFPYAGDGMNRKAAMDPMVVIQDDFNDAMNAFWEIGEYGWPSRYIDAENDDLDAIFDQKASPYAYRGWKARQNQALKDSFYQEANPEIPKSIWEWAMAMMGPIAQFILACPPSIFGAGDPHQDTASGQQALRSQAMGQQGIPWMAVQRMFARIYDQAAKLAAKLGGMITVPNKNGGVGTYQLEKLNGNFRAYPDQDSSFPESTAAKRANLMQLITLAMQAPQIGEQILAAPDNWEVMQDQLGQPDLVIPEVEARNKQLAEIEEMLKESPLPASDQEVQAYIQQHAEATIAAREMGQPDPPPLPPDPEQIRAMLPKHSTVTPKPEDFHTFEIAKCQDYLSSPAAREYQAESASRAAENPDGPPYDPDNDGLANIRLHIQEHIKAKIQWDAMTAPLAPPMPAAPPAAAPHGPPKPPINATASKKPPAAQHKLAAPAGAPGTETL